MVAIPVFEHKMAQFFCFFVFSRTMEVHHICVQNLTWGKKKGRRYVRTAEDVCDYILCGHQLNNTLSSWRYSGPPFFSSLIFLHSSPCSPLLSDNTAAVFCQPERGSLIAIDTSRAQQVMWLHTHRPVTVKLGLHVVLLRGRGQNMAMSPDTHPPGRSVAWTQGTHRAQRAAPPTERAQQAFSSHLPIRHSPSST